MTEETHDYEREQHASRRGIKFDPTINLGHILTFVALLLAGFGAWSALDKRVTIIEESRYAQKMLDSNQDSRAVETTTQLKEVLTRLDRQVERLADKLDKAIPSR